MWLRKIYKWYLIIFLLLLISIALYNLTGYRFFLVLLLFTITIAVSILLAKPFYHKANRIQYNWLTILAICIITIPLILFAIFVFIVLDCQVETRNCICLVCDKTAKRTSFFGIILHSTDKQSPTYSKNGYNFEKWYWEKVAIEHTHDLEPSGGGEIGCVFIISYCGVAPWDMIGGFFKRTILYAPDKIIAVSIARKIAQASPDERRKLLISFVNPGDYKLHPSQEEISKLPPDEQKIVKGVTGNKYPWRALSEKETLTRDDFLKYYKVWLKYHPEWQK